MKIPEAFANAGKKIVSQITEFPGTQVEPAFDASQNLEEVSKLDITWLPFAAKTYHISANLSDYVLVNHMICPSDIPNRNGIGFPTAELVAYQPPPMNRQVFKAWAGCPVHEEHDNEDCTKAVGVIFDTSFRPIQGYGDGKHWAVYGLIGIDKTKYPELAQEVLAGRINTGSMGCMADHFTCAICNQPASDNQFMNCNHIASTKNVNWKIIAHEGEQKVAYLNAHGLSPIEYSIVRDPAWASCLSDAIIQK
jgi:hypothetical protein